MRLRRLEKAITEIIITNIVSFFLNDTVLKLFFFFLHRGCSLSVLQFV